MAIAKTASRNVAFKVAKMRESIMEDQDELLIRKLEYEDVDLETNNDNTGGTRNTNTFFISNKTTNI